MSGYDIEQARLRAASCALAHAEIEIEKSRVLDLCRSALPPATFQRLRLLLFRYEDALRELLREKDGLSDRP